MDHRLMEDLHNGFCEVLHDIAGSKMGTREVEVAKNAISGILKLKCIEEMENYRGSSYRGRSYEGMSNDGSYRRSHDGNGGSGGSYRGNSGRNYRDGGSMREKLENLMDEAQGKEREMIQEMLSRM